MDYRALAAAVLGVLLGGALILAPGAVVRVHLAGRVPSGRGGKYGEEGELPARWRWLVRAVGVVVVAIGLYFGTTAIP